MHDAPLTCIHRLTLLAIFIAASVSLISQPKLSREFGRIGKDDLEYTPDDTEAPAVVLFDIGETRFIRTDSWFEIKFTRTKRVKILSEEGLDYGNISIQYYSDGYGRTEKVEDIKCFTYNLTSTHQLEKTELNPKEVYSETVNNYWEKKVFAMPQVKPGSVIDIQYTVYSPFFFNLPDWEFQSDIPTVYSQYEVSMIPFYEYIYLLQGISQFDEQTSIVDPGLRRQFRGIEFQDYVHTYVMKDVPAFKDESFISSPNDYIMKLDFQLSKYHPLTGGDVEVMTTWPKLIDDYDDHEKFGKYVKKSQRTAKDIIEGLALSDLSDEAKSKIIIEYVKQNFTWNKIYGEHANQKPNELLKTKSGNIGSINLFLLGMLQEAGINAKPVIISTRSHGKVHSKYPFASFFNYVVILVDLGSTSYLADGSESDLPFNRIPTRCMNGMGLLMQEDYSWIDLYSGIESWDIKSITLEPDLQQGVLKSSVISSFTEFDAYTTKKKFDDDPEKIEESLRNEGFQNISDIRTKNFDKISSPYIMACAGEYPLEIIDDKIVIKPFLHFPWGSNPLSQKERNYPVDFVYKHNEQYNSAIIIPEGYHISYIPQNLSLDNAIATITYSASEMKGRITIMAKLAFKKSVYQSDEYHKLQSTLAATVKKFNDAIVLEKSE
ncbi:MAG: DUF3857 domain-containing protein [Cyclobacteriaceae bacterium]